MNDKITFTITRRKLTELLMGLVGVFLASGILAAILKYLWPAAGRKGASSEIRIASVDEVPAGTAKKFMFHGKPAVLLKRPVGLRAFGAVCTHLGCIAYWKPDENDIFCPCHLGRFDPDTGDVISGPPPSRLPSIDIAVKNGAVYALRWRDPDYVKSLSMYAGAV